MATITIRGLPDKTKEILRVHAAQSGLSLEAYIREILRDASHSKPKKAVDILDLAESYFGSKHGIDLELPQRNTKRKPVNLSS